MVLVPHGAVTTHRPGGRCALTVARRWGRAAGDRACLVLSLMTPHLGWLQARGASSAGAVTPHPPGHSGPHVVVAVVLRWPGATQPARSPRRAGGTLLRWQRQRRWPARLSGVRSPSSHEGRSVSLYYLARSHPVAVTRRAMAAWHGPHRCDRVTGLASVGRSRCP